MSYFEKTTVSLGIFACVVYCVVDSTNRNQQTILYPYNCLRFLGLEVLQVGESLQDFIQKHEKPWRVKMACLFKKGVFDTPSLKAAILWLGISVMNLCLTGCGLHGHGSMVKAQHLWPLPPFSGRR